jgi:hypothetical protein
MKELNTISVGELKAILENYDDETPVAFACNYGDRGRTLQVINICGNDSMEAIHETAYSESGFAVTRDMGDSEDDEDPLEVLIIR